MRDVVELGSGIMAAKMSRHTVADRIAAIETKKLHLKKLAKTAE